MAESEQVSSHRSHLTQPRRRLVTGKVVDRESNKMDRWIKEAIHIRKEQDSSMKRDEGSYQLSHIYDRLFTTTSGGERKLSIPFQRRQQPLPKRQQKI